MLGPWEKALVGREGSKDGQSKGGRRWCTWPPWRGPVSATQHLFLCEEQSHIPPCKGDSEGAASCCYRGQLGTLHSTSEISQDQGTLGLPLGISLEVGLDSKEGTLGKITESPPPLPTSHSPV